MTESIKHTITDNAKEIADQVISNPKAQAVVVGVSTGSAIDYQIMQWLPTVVSLTAGILGIVLTSLMIVKTYIQIKNDLKKGA